MIIGGSRLMFVHATVDAANTALLCRNDLNSVMDFSSSEEDMKIKEVLVDEYSEKISRKEYPRFEKEIRSVFDKYAPGQGKWRIKLLQGTAEAEELISLSEFGEVEEKKNLQTCNYFVPLPCDKAIEKCAMEVQLELVP